ncbi:hypothetical protein [Paraburkholderia sp. BR14320]|uniref:hypothetical protein n=1 Tax=unclassified Paraburkholderia TaxID=2615204 RepID=UPI0034CDA2E8
MNHSEYYERGYRAAVRTIEAGEDWTERGMPSSRWSETEQRDYSCGYRAAVGVLYGFEIEGLTD